MPLIDLNLSMYTVLSSRHGYTREDNIKMQFHSKGSIRLLATIALLLSMLPSCGKEPPEWTGGSSDGDSDGDADADTDEDSDEEGETDPEEEPEVPEGSVIAYRGTPALDGTLEETLWVLDTDASRVIEGNGNNVILFGLLWDEEHLYVGVDVDDPNRKTDNPMFYQNDSVEVFLDGDNNKGHTYDKHDAEYAIVLGSDEMLVSDERPINTEQAWDLSDNIHYTVEIAIPWDDLDVSPSDGAIIGFDLGMNDNDDNNRDRDAHHMWMGTDDNWEDTSEFGNMVLTSEPPPEE